MKLEPNIPSPAVFEKLQMVENQPIRRTMLFDNEDKKEHVYMLSKSKVVNVNHHLYWV